MTRRKKESLEGQLQLAFANLCEMKSMAALVFKGMTVVENQPDVIARKKVLREQTSEIDRRRKA